MSDSTMVVYLLHDDDPNGGYFSAMSIKPDPTLERGHTVEIRAVREFPVDVWEFAMSGGLPVDVDHSNDSTWIEWWDDAEPVWKRTTDQEEP